MRSRLLCLIALVCPVGCTTGPKEPTATQKQDAVLVDPMNYKPVVGHDISDGNISHFGDGFNQDLHDALNP